MYILHRTGYEAGAVGAASGGKLRRLWATLAAWRRRRVERRCVTELDDRMRTDIGCPHRVGPPRVVRLDRGQ